MKLLSNFDTTYHLKVFEKAKKEYGKDNVLLVQRDKIYFILNVVLPLLGFFLLFLIFLVIALVWDWGGTGNKIKWALFVIVFVPSFLIVAGRALKKYIDYKLDFALITPYQVSFYNQQGIFSRNLRTLDVDKIKTITVEKKGFLRSLFNFGSIVFLAEGDMEGRGSGMLNYINAPERLKEKIKDIIRIYDQTEGQWTNHSE